MEEFILGSWWVISTLLSAAGLLYVYWYLNNSHDYWRKRGVPYVKPFPLFGNLKDTMLGKKSLCENHQDIYW
jgi:hypothetical protein